jgi:hypothetical protein
MSATSGMQPEISPNPPIPPIKPPPIYTGQLTPKYQILGLLYAPPGTNGGKSSSQVAYGSGSTTGTTNSVSNSFKESVDISASIAAGLGVNAEFTASVDTTDTSQVVISKTETSQISVAGPAQDGISHGNDLFYLWLNPLLDVTVEDGRVLSWQLSVTSPPMIIQYVYASWLQNPSLIPAGVAQLLSAHGFTTADYAQILACNPFSSGSTAIDPNRFVPTLFSFPYEPPEAAGDPVPTMTFTQTNATTVTDTAQVQVQYGVTVGISASTPTATSAISASFKASGSLDWTVTATTTTSDESTQSATVTVGGPAFGYTGPTDVLVYWDTVFNSFMFAFAAGNPVAAGTVTSANQPVAYQPITLEVGGVTLSTFTDAGGNYRFYGTAAGQGTITVSKQEFTVAVGSAEPPAALQVA